MPHRAHHRIILIAEDSDDDFEAVEAAFLDGGARTFTVCRVTTGQCVLERLSDMADDAAAGAGPLPALVMLDLNLPGVTGREVLGTLKTDERLRSVPVIVMTSSTDERDVAACYQAGANAYLQKPMELKTLFAAVALIKAFWLETVILPT